MANQKLGRGFDVLIPKNFDTTIIEEDKNRVQKLLITDIIPNSEQPRSTFDVQNLNELADSVKQHGVLQPIIVVRHNNKYRIVAGERRWRAAQVAQLSHIPAIVRSLQELEQLELALIENIQRVDLNPLEQATAIYRLQQQFGLAFEQIAIKLGKAVSTVSNISRLLNLPDTAKKALIDKNITEGHARAILSLASQPTKQEELLKLIRDNKWTVRQAEQFVVATKKGEDKIASVARTIYTNNSTEKLAKKLNTKVGIRRTAKGGQLLIEFKSDVELESLIKLFNDIPAQQKSKKKRN